MHDYIADKRYSKTASWVRGDVFSIFFFFKYLGRKKRETLLGGGGRATVKKTS